MHVKTPCVVGLTWKLSDARGEVLDELADAVEFMVGGDDLPPAVESALQGRSAGEVLDLNLEPEQAFGHYDEQLVFLLPRTALPAGVEAGLLIEAGSLPKGSVPGVAASQLLTISDIYPDHVVLDGNHPLAGMALRLHARLAHVRAASKEEQERGTAGVGFFRLRASDSSA